MNMWQIAQQLKYILENLVWDNGSVKMFLGGVYITHYPNLEILPKYTTPFCLINVLNGELDPDDQRTGQRDLQVIPFFSSPTSRYGEAQIIGKDITEGTADGRGILEIEEAFNDSLTDLNFMDGFSDSLNFKGVGNIEEESDFSYTAYLFTAYFGKKDYQSVPYIYYSVSGSDVTLNWWAVPDRFDLIGQGCVRNTTPPTDKDDGTDVSIATKTTETVDNTVPGANTYYYGFYGIYDERATGDSANYKYSPLEILKVVVP